MKNKVAILAFIGVAIICVTALIIWQDLKSDIRAAQKPVVAEEKKDAKLEAQTEAIENIRRELELGESNCFVDWKNREVWAKLSMDHHRTVKCSVDAAKKLKVETIQFFKETLVPLL